MKAVEEHSFESGTAFLSVFAILLLIVTFEGLYEYGPFFLWRLSIEPYNLALYNRIVYAIILLIIGSAFFYYGFRLIWHGWKQRRK